MATKATATATAAQDAEPRRVNKGLVELMATEAHLNVNTYMETVRAVACPQGITREQFTAFLMVCHEHRLNPITREIYGFESRGKIQPIVSIDGWLKIINERPEFDGMEFEDVVDDENGLVAITCRIYRKDRKHPTEVTEYMRECKRGTDVWKNWPARMLRHKATIQAARYAFGFSGIFDQDEAERGAPINMGEAEIVEETPETPATRLKSKIKEKVRAEDIAPPDDDDRPSVDDIPGLKPASELADEADAEVVELDESAQEWVEDYEGEKPAKGK